MEDIHYYQGIYQAIGYDFVLSIEELLPLLTNQTTVFMGQTGVGTVSYTHLDVYKRQVLYTGATVEEAIQKGLNDLDIPRMKAHITVVAREKKGFLGLFGKKPAQVEIEPIAETTVVKANQKAVKGVPDEILSLIHI